MILGSSHISNIDMQVYCRFLRDDGYCSKGKYCEFSHDKSAANVACKAFSSTGKCRFGTACSFAHRSSVSTAKTDILRPPIVSIKDSKLYPIASSSSSTNSTVKSSPDKNKKVADSSNNYSSIWGFDDSNDNGVYFYGAPGTFPQQDQLASTDSYASIARSNTESTEIEPSESGQASSISKKKQICSFFLVRSCKFGDFCRNSHEIEDESITVVSETIDDSSYPECGICISKPDDSMYGMLNNCDCSFCLKCIRGWRKDGIEVAKDTQQVRRCPLCRTESYFICPSSRILKGTSKQIALDAYKLSMKRIPCKVSVS
jgi:E3 ubiquitin-protein ligase makorin